MLQPARQEVPSLELGPPSPNWIDQLVGSPVGELKPSARHEAPSCPSPRFATTWIQLLTEESVSSRRDTQVQERAQTRHRTVVVGREAASSSRATSESLPGPASCESRKRAKRPNCQSSSPKYEKRRRVVPSGEKTTTTANELERWSSALSTDALSETFLAPSAMDMEREATEEFMNEFWGNLMLDASPVSNDSLIAAASPFDELRLPLSPLPAAQPDCHLLDAAQPDCHLLDDVTEDQLLELTQFLDTAAPAPAPAPATATVEVLPSQPAAAPAISEGPVAAPIDLAALLQETEIVFGPELAADQAASVEPTPPAPAPAPAPSAEPTRYLLVLPPPAQEPAAPSVTSDLTDDTARWTSTSTEAEELEEEAEEVQVVEAPRPSRKRAPRRPPAATPAEKYRRIRDNNNEASRRSRQQRKQREVDTQARAEELQAENGRLRQKVDVLESLLERVKALAPLLTAKR